jgi:hypothetical protein
LCHDLGREVPPLDWQVDMIAWRDTLTDLEKTQLAQYQNYGYQPMNEQLRHMPHLWTVNRNH